MMAYLCLANCLIQLLFTHEHRLICLACLHSLLVVSVAWPSAALPRKLLDGLRSEEGSFFLGNFRRAYCKQSPSRARTLSKEFFRAPCFALEAPSASRKVASDI